MITTGPQHLNRVLESKSPAHQPLYPPLFHPRSETHYPEHQLSTLRHGHYTTDPALGAVGELQQPPYTIPDARNRGQVLYGPEFQDTWQECLAQFHPKSQHAALPSHAMPSEEGMYSFGTRQEGLLKSQRPEYRVRTSNRPLPERGELGGGFDELFQSVGGEPVIRTGFMIEPSTGEMYETYENDVQPPTSASYLGPDELSKVNRRLLNLHGGVNHRLPPPVRKEVVPDPVSRFDGRLDPRFQQVINDQHRAETQERVARQLWHSRDNHQEFQETETQEIPAGMLGQMYYLRPKPYMPATFSGHTELLWRPGADGSQLTQPSNQQRCFATTELRDDRDTPHPQFQGNGPVPRQHPSGQSQQGGPAQLESFREQHRAQTQAAAGQRRGGVESTLFTAPSNPVTTLTKPKSRRQDQLSWTPSIEPPISQPTHWSLPSVRPTTIRHSSQTSTSNTTLNSLPQTMNHLGGQERQFKNQGGQEHIGTNQLVLPRISTPASTANARLNPQKQEYLSIETNRQLTLPSASGGPPIQNVNNIKRQEYLSQNLPSALELPQASRNTPLVRQTATMRQEYLSSPTVTTIAPGSSTHALAQNERNSKTSSNVEKTLAQLFTSLPLVGGGGGLKLSERPVKKATDREQQKLGQIQLPRTATNPLLKTVDKLPGKRDTLDVLRSLTLSMPQDNNRLPPAFTTQPTHTETHQTRVSSINNGPLAGAIQPSHGRLASKLTGENTPALSSIELPLAFSSTIGLATIERRQAQERPEENAWQGGKPENDYQTTQRGDIRDHDRGQFDLKQGHNQAAQPDAHWLQTPSTLAPTQQYSSQQSSRDRAEQEPGSLPSCY
jgi:hypothetical protein